MVTTQVAFPVDLTPINQSIDFLASGKQLPSQQEALSTTSATEVILKEFSGTGFIFVQANGLGGIGGIHNVRVTSDLMGTEFNIAHTNIPDGEGQVICCNPAFIKNGGRIYGTSDGTDTLNVHYCFVRLRDLVTLTASPSDWGTMWEFLPNNTNKGSAMTVAEANTNNQHAVVKFDLSSIAVGANIVRATVRLVDTNTAGIDNNVDFHALKTAWTGADVSWNERQSGVNWDTSGAQGSGDIVQSAFASSIINLGVDSVYFYEITDLVRQWFSGSFANNGFIMVNTFNGGSKKIELASEANPTVPNRPTLEIEFF